MGRAALPPDEKKARLRAKQSAWNKRNAMARAALPRIMRARTLEAAQRIAREAHEWRQGKEEG